MAKKTKRKSTKKAPPKPELYFVELSAKSTPFSQIVFGDGTLYGLDDSGRVFAYADGSGWFQVESDNRRFLVGTKREPMTASPPSAENGGRFKLPGAPPS